MKPPVTPIPESALNAGHRNWTGNDASQRTHHGVVRLNESPLHLKLSWKESRDAPVQLIGCYKLDLHELLRREYIRYEGAERNEEIRLRFFHQPDDRIVIQVNESGPALIVGTFVRG